MINDLLLLSGQDIPFEKASITIHVPKLKEIALIGQDNFYAGCEILLVSKDKLLDSDKNDLDGQSNFNIFMTIMKDRTPSIMQKTIPVRQLLSLLFPFYKISFSSNMILEKEDQRHSINEKNFPLLQDYIAQMFCLVDSSKEGYRHNNSAQAKYLEEKFKKAHAKIAKMREAQNENKEELLKRQISILAVGERKNLNDLMEYTVYQLFDELKRYQLKYSYDIHLKAQLAGAKDLEEVKNWME